MARDTTTLLSSPSFTMAAASTSTVNITVTGEQDNALFEKAVALLEVRHAALEASDAKPNYHYAC